MTSLRQLFLLLLFLPVTIAARPPDDDDDAPVIPVAAIELPNVTGRIDHFGIDLRRRRLSIAALGNDTVEVVDFKEGIRKRSMRGFAEPQGVLHDPGTDRLFVANGKGDRVDIIDGASLSRIAKIDGLEDADNIRLDPDTHRIYVGYGNGALRAIEAATGKSVGDIQLAGHPEAFALEKKGSRIFVNVPTAHHVAVVDRAKGAVVSTWAVAEAEGNFPMALDEAGKRLFVGTRSPGLLLVYDIETGKVVARQEIGKDTDDLFFDAVRKRIYVICGEGRIDVVKQLDPDHYSLESTVSTAPRARTGLFVPENRRLYVAAPSIGASPARVLTYRVR
jgi:DNA-binding beta-propeller fold protein YncE